MVQPSLPFAPLEAADARRMMTDAVEWIDENPLGWAFIVASARDDANRRGRVRIKRYIEDLRDDPSVVRQQGPVKIQNALSAPFGRILAAWYPELAPCIPMHSSKTDGVVVPMPTRRAR